MTQRSRLAPPKACAMMEALRGLGYSTAAALADVVDNSVSAVASEVRLRFDWDGANSRISILDDGRGMSDQSPHVAAGSAVRRLTPTECERLQGFPDGWTAIPWRNKPESECPDGPRYKAIGNSKAVPVVRWIGERLLSNLAMFKNELGLPNG